jgi:hypothetical protein
MSLIVNFNFIYCSYVDILRKNNRLSSVTMVSPFLIAARVHLLIEQNQYFLHSTKEPNGLIFLFWRWSWSNIQNTYWYFGDVFIYYSQLQLLTTHIRFMPKEPEFKVKSFHEHYMSCELLDTTTSSGCTFKF